MSLDVTAIDFFCGAGGSSTGLVNAGIRVTGAANHWKLAIETHNTNHPDTEHYQDDLQAAHPSWYPRADIAWFSPECQNHSLAKGKKRKGIGQLDLWGEHKIDPAEEKSRATMREVVEFSEYHRYDIVIVENVVDVRKWQYFDEWLGAMLNLGYDYHICYFNAMFFGVPQSRDRFYAVFWKRGNRRPDLDYRPLAVCSKHGQIEAVQSFKKPEFRWGRYGQRRQYTYRCPVCGEDVIPAFRAAAEVIDWLQPSERIGDRAKPLKDKTVQRIRAGLVKFGNWAHIADLGHTHAEHEGKVKSVDEPLATQTTRQQLALVQPFIASQHEGREAVRGVDRELPCVTTMNEHALVTPPFLIVQRCTDTKDGVNNPVNLDEPLRTIVAGANQHALITPPFMVVLKNSHSIDGQYTLPPKSLDQPLSTIATASQEALITPPFIAELRRTGQARGTDEPLATVVAGGTHHALVTTPFIMTYNGEPVYRLVDQPMPTIPTHDRHALITPDDVLPNCGFRMLEPHELQKAQSFPDEYVILGSKRDKVKQIGHAVACNVAEWIAQRCVESLS